jgi:hyperosmotically inducible periplasmic protein
LHFSGRKPPLARSLRLSLHFSDDFSHKFEKQNFWHTERYVRRMKRKLVLFSLVAVAAAGIVGCASDDRADRESHKRTTGQYIDDKVLVQRVKSALNDSEVYKFPNVKANTYEGTVQLTGFVDTEEQKNKAEEIVRSVRGVANVQNQITLKPEGERVRERDANGTYRTNNPPRTTTP